MRAYSMNTMLINVGGKKGKKNCLYDEKSGTRTHATFVTRIFVLRLNLNLAP